MTVKVSIERAAPRILAAVRRRVHLGEVAAAFRPASDAVWAFLRKHPGLREDGHNVFLYHHPADGRDGLMDVDFGVEVVRAFEPEGDVRCVATPAGEFAVATHIGPYGQLRATHDAVHAWARANHRAIGAQSFEVYGDWSDDPAKLETRVWYVLD